MLPRLQILMMVLERLPAAEGDACQVWPGSINSSGYGKVTLWGVGTYYTHRVMYGATHGFVPPDIDHLCRNRRCARPDHLEAVSHVENMARAGYGGGSACGAGHVWADVGWWSGRNGRKCKACHRRAARESARRRKLYTGE